MNLPSLFQVSDQALTAGLKEAVSREREVTASLLAYIAEFDARGLFAPAGYSSMHRYLVEALGLSEDAAYKRLQAARAGRDHPLVFRMVADGRLHLTAIVRLAPHLRPENASSLLDAASGRTKSELEQLLAERFPQRDLQAMVRAVPSPPVAIQLVPEPVALPAATELVAEPPAGPNAEASAPALVPEPVPSAATSASSAHHARPRVALRSPERYGVQFMVSSATHELLRRVEALVGHRLSSEEMERALAAGLQTYTEELEKRRLSATDRPRRPGKAPRGRSVPAAVRRQVWKRDAGRCTFVAESGKRCDEQSNLQYDHILPVARGGKSTADNVRLRCWAHNQFEAERVFGRGFMQEIRARSRRAG